MEFLARRLEALQRVQHFFGARERPDQRADNYGLLTSVFNFMLFSSGNTATQLPVYTREALRDLQLSNVMNRFGMFFLHNLTLNTSLVREYITCLLDMSNVFIGQSFGGYRVPR